MPEETVGVNTGEQAPARESPAPDAAPQRDAQIVSGAIDRAQPDSEAAPQGGGEHDPVPYSRFSEVNQKMRAAEEQARAASQQAQQLQQMLRAVVAQVQTGQQQQRQQQTQVSERDRQRESLRQRILANAQSEEEADNALSLIEEAARLASREGDEGLESRLAQRFESLLNDRLGSFAGAFQIDRELSDMQRDGLIDGPNSQQIREQMRQVISQNPDWGRPENQRILLNNLCWDAVKRRDMKPGSYNQAMQHRGGSGPLQPGNGQPRPRSQRQVAETHDKDLVAIQDRFPRVFGEMSIAQLREMFPPDTRPALPDIETSQYGDVPARVARDRYVHRRPNPR